MAKKKPQPLTPKQKVFVLEYLVDRNGKQSAIRAGYSPKTADAQASRLLTNEKVRQYLDALVTKQHERLKLDADTVLQELLAILVVDPLDMLDENGAILPMSDIPSNVRRAISSFEVVEMYSGTGDARRKIGETKKVKMWSKTGSADLLGKHLRLWMDAQINLNFDFLGHLDGATKAIDAEAVKDGE